MIIFIKGPFERKRIDIGIHDKLNKKIQEAFNAEYFTLSVDENNKIHLDGNLTFNELNITKGTTIYMHYDIIKKDIKRERDKLMCDHDIKAMCANCAPLDPWDEKYMFEKKIKYLSFGSYKEMYKYKNNDLIMEDYTIKICKDHAKNIKCVNCQEKDILLNPQRYRMVDHVEFDDYTIVENLIKLWKDSRKQYVGILIGKYKSYELVPLGRKAVVSGIWIPEQENFPDGFVINEKFDIDFLKQTDLECVGMIYTDLVYDGKITSSKLKSEIFLSSLEIDFISKMQFMFPNFEKRSDNKNEIPIIFNSKFVTIVITANQQNEIELMEYQVSSQCMALSRNSLILPTDNPKFFFTQKNIFYKIVEEDGSLKTVKAEPFLPVEYFIVRLTHGNKQNPLFQNNSFIGNTITNKKLAKYFEDDYSFEKFSNFNLLMKIRNKITDFNRLLRCIVENDKNYFKQFVTQNDYKELIYSLQRFYKNPWVCNVCTFINEHNLDICEVCESKNF